MSQPLVFKPFTIDVTGNGDPYQSALNTKQAANIQQNTANRLLSGGNTKKRGGAEGVISVAQFPDNGTLASNTQYNPNDTIVKMASIEANMKALSEFDGNASKFKGGKRRYKKSRKNKIKNRRNKLKKTKKNTKRRKQTKK